MNSRERVLAAIEHREPDRVPADLGATIMSGIMAQAIPGLRRCLGLDDRPPKVYEPFQMLGEVEEDLVEALGVDVLPVEPPAQFFGIRRENYKPFRLFDDTPVLVPGQFNVEVDDQGRWLLHEQGDAARPVTAIMPKEGFYFDMVGDQAMHEDFQPPPLAHMRKQYRTPADERDLEYLAAKAQRLRPTGKALVLGAWGYIGPAGVGNFADWMCVMAGDPDYARRLFEIKIEADLARLEKLKRYIGDTIDVLGVDGNDYGTQRAEMFSPAMFEQFYFPYYQAICGWVHAHTKWKTWKHCCGSIPRFIPFMVEAGIDCLNPVQCSAAGMEPAWLKQTFGNRLTFWGGGIDTQKTLPFGTPEQVYEQARERLRIFKPGGGYVFNAVHNIQHGTPPENIAAMFQALKDHGKYTADAGKLHHAAGKG